LRRYVNLPAKQQRAELVAFQAAVNHQSPHSTVTKADIAFITMYLTSFGHLEQSDPAIFKIHPLILPNLGCKALATRTKHS
jgi:hypothetical protein